MYLNIGLKSSKSLFLSSLLAFPIIFASTVNSQSQNYKAQASDYINKNGYVLLSDGRSVRTESSFKYGGKQTKYKVLGGVIKCEKSGGKCVDGRKRFASVRTKDDVNFCIQNSISNETCMQIVSFGTSGSRTSGAESIDKALMEAQGFRPLYNNGKNVAVGNSDKKVEAWVRRFNKDSTFNRDETYISANGNDVGWSVFLIGVDMPVTDGLQKNVGISGRRSELTDDNYLRVPLRLNKSSFEAHDWSNNTGTNMNNNTKFKFISMFLDDSTEIVDADRNQDGFDKVQGIVSFVRFGDGDTFFSLVAGDGNLLGRDPAHDTLKLKVRQLEDRGFDSAVITTFMK